MLCDGQALGVSIQFLENSQIRNLCVSGKQHTHEYSAEDPNVMLQWLATAIFYLISGTVID